MAIRVLIAERQPQKRENLRAFLTTDIEIEIAGMARDGQEALHLAHRLHPDIAILSVDLAVKDGFQIAEYLAAAVDLPTVSILLSETDTPEQLRRAMRAGAREFLAWPSMRSSLMQMLHDLYDEQQRRVTPSFAAEADPRNNTRVIAIGGAKGGIGKSALTTNLAVALALETGEPTAVLDLHTQFGDVAQMLNVEPRRTLMDLIEMGEQAIDVQLLEYCMETHDTGLRVLTTSKHPVALDSIAAPFLDTILGLMKQLYRYVIMDVPLYLHPGTLHAFSHATSVLLVTNRYDITTIHDTQILLETLVGKYVDRGNIAMVLNRVSSNDVMQETDIERALGCPIIAHVPNDGQVVPRSINDGVPFIVSNPNSPVSQSVLQLAHNMAQRQPGIKESVVLPSMPRPFNWLFGNLQYRAGEQRKAA